MDFGFGEDAERLREEVRQFLEKEWPKGLTNWRGWLQPDTPEFLERGKEFDRKLAAMGWLGLGIPKEYGGKDAPLWNNTWCLMR